METTLQLSTLQNLRSRITLIEFFELGLIGFAVWGLFVGMSISSGEFELMTWTFGLFIIEGIVLGSWLIYNLYIRIARAGGRAVDIAFWVLGSFATASYTFWAWTILDINRFLVAKLFYQGEAPVEYAWSSRSKEVRKAWEQLRKTASI